MRSASAVQNLAHFVYILDHIHPWFLYHKNQWNDAKKKLIPWYLKSDPQTHMYFTELPTIALGRLLLAGS